MNKEKNFFEGWYFKHQTTQTTLALIPSQTIDLKGNKKPSIQIITNNRSYNIDFHSSEYFVDYKNFIIKIGNNTFSKKGLSLDIKSPDINLKGDLNYGPLTPLNYNIMGPFCLFPFMECHHGVISLYHTVNGSLFLNDHSLSLNSGVGYIETDWGRSFPKTYLWTQANLFSNEPICIMVSIAEIPFLKHTFSGCIAVVYYKGIQYRLATYKGVSIIKADHDGIILKQGHYELIIDFLSFSAHPLLAPLNGVMSRTIHESPSCRARYRFYINKLLLFDLTSDHASYEIV